MPIARLPYKLSSRGSIARADIEAIYGEAVRTIGGAYYLNTSPIGPANGVLNYQNFKPDAGITNNHKAQREGVSILSITAGSYTSTLTASFYIALPADSTPEMSGIVTGWTATARQCLTQPNTGTASLWYIRKLAPAVQIGTTQTLTNVASFTVDVNVSGLSVPILSRDVLKIDYAISTAAVTVTDLVFHVYLKMKHSR